MTSVTDTHPTLGPGLGGWDSIEFWVGNARTTASLLIAGFGFSNTGYAGPETGLEDRVSYVLEQGTIRFVVTAGLSPESPITAHVAVHGDGVHDLAWLADDAPAAAHSAIGHGARAVRDTWQMADDDGVMTLATIGTYGETQHTFVDRTRYHGPSLAPGYGLDRLLPDPVGPTVGLTRVDHVVGNVEAGALEHWVDFYGATMGFTELRHFDESQIATEYSALRSTVVWNGRDIVMPINEPAAGLRKSQIQEYLEAYNGPGVQHIALATDDIVATVAALRDRGVRFMAVPDEYYDDARLRLTGVDLPWEELRRHSVLVDREDDGHLLQIFTETITDRPTVFFEIIERRGARGFGEGNFKALFEAIERDQAARGHL